MGGSHYLNYAGNGSNFDFFHIGALLVVIMAVVTGIVLIVAVVGVCCFHWLDDFQDRKKISPQHNSNPQNRSHHHHHHRHRSDSQRSNSTASVVVEATPSSHRARDVFRNSFIRDHIIRFEECPYPTGKIISRDADNIDDEPPPPYDFLFPTPTSPATTPTTIAIAITQAGKIPLSPQPPPTLTTNVDISTDTNEDRNSGDASTRF